MAWRRAYRVVPTLFLLAAVACDGGDPLAPSFMLVNAPGNLTASTRSFSEIALAWEDNSRNESGFEIWRSPTGAPGSFTYAATAGPLATSYNDAGLRGSTQYCYQVRAFRVTGKRSTPSDFSAVACATTPRAPVPNAPSGLMASPYSGYAIRVSWTDNSVDDNGFRVERALSAAGPWTTIADVPSYYNTTVVTDYQVPLEGLRYYRAFAYNGYGDSDPSNVAFTAIPTTPSNLAASVSGSAVDLTWTDNSGVEDGVEVQRAAAGEAWSVVATLPANATTYHDASLSPDVAYNYFVRAMRDGGPSGSSNVVEALIATAPPAAPGPIFAYPNGSTAAAVYWQPNSSNEAGYRIERSTDGGTSWNVAGTAGRGETGFVDYGPLVSEQPVCYRVVAFNQIGDSPASDTECATPIAGPTGINATLLADGSVDLSWTDNSNLEDGYQVWVWDGYFDSFVIADLDPNTTSFNDGGYYYGYYFAVVAVKNGSYSDFSDWVYAVPAGSPARRARPPAPSAKPKPMLRPRHVQGVPR